MLKPVYYCGSPRSQENSLERLDRSFRRTQKTRPGVSQLLLDVSNLRMFNLALAVKGRNGWSILSVQPGSPANLNTSFSRL